MSDLPVISGVEAVKAFERAGFNKKRQRGSHIIIRRDAPFCQFVIPNHKILDRGALRAIIRCSMLTIFTFIVQMYAMSNPVQKIAV